MSIFYHNPENSLKRANEFLEIGKYGDAIECLYDVLKNRKNRLLKTTHEPIINKLLDICVEHRLSVPAKDGLYLYRIICQGINIKSWEDAVKRLIFLADQKLRPAITDIPDKAINPKNVLQQNDIEGNDGRSDAMMISPWIKFMWDCYRFCLDLLKNTQSEKFYHYIAQNAFRFCVQYSRKMEFRKLCNVLRTHLGYLRKRHNQLLQIENSQDIINLYLDTGIVELDSALDLELWPEVFKAVEDIHLAIDLLKKPANSKIIANYFKKLAWVFWKANDLLHHAAALLRYFLLSRDLKKNLSSDDISSMASLSTLAILSIPFPPSNPSIDLVAETDVTLIEKKNRLLSTLLNFTNNPSRESLTRDLERCNVVQAAPLEIQNLFHVLENELDLRYTGKKCTDLITTLNKGNNQIDLKQYFPHIYNIAIVKVLVQVSKVYQTITISKFASLVPPVDSYELETHIVEFARRYDLPVRVDHRNRCLRFNSMLNLFQKEYDLIDSTANILPKDQTRNYLSMIHTSLSKIVNSIHPNEKKNMNEEIVKGIRQRYLSVRGSDRKEMLQRKKVIAKHKDRIESMRLEKENEERRLIVEKQSKYETAEKERLLKEAKAREAQKRILQEKEIRKQVLQEKIENLKKSQIGLLIENMELSELDSLDADILLSKHIEKERRLFLARLHRKERTTHHMERAKRIEEIPLLKQKYDIDRGIAKEMWEQNDRERIQNACAERSRIVQNKNRFSAMKEDLEAFVDKIRQRKRLDYEEECVSFRELLQQEREKRLKEISLRRKSERRLAWEGQMKEVVKRSRGEHRSRKNETPASSNPSNSFVDRTAGKIPKCSSSQKPTTHQTRSFSNTRSQIQNERIKDNSNIQECKSPKLNECKSPPKLNRNMSSAENRIPLKEAVYPRNSNPNEVDKQCRIPPERQILKRDVRACVDDKIHREYSPKRYHSNVKNDYSLRNDYNSKSDGTKCSSLDSHSNTADIKPKEYSLWRNDWNSKRDANFLKEYAPTKQNYGSSDIQPRFSRTAYNSKIGGKIETEYSSYRSDSKMDNIKPREYSLWGNDSYSKLVSPKKSYERSDRQSHFSGTVGPSNQTIKREASTRFNSEYSLFRNPNPGEFLSAISNRTSQPGEELVSKTQKYSTALEFGRNQFGASEKQKFDVRRSCTPWAKMQRKENPN